MSYLKKTPMKKTLLVLILVSMIPVFNYAQKVFNFPSSSNKIIDITIDTKTWSVDNTEGIMTISPLSSAHSNNFVCMIWASEDPSSETAVDDIAEQASTVVSTLLSDITWAEEVTDFENNGITFVGTDGVGYYVADDGSSTKMVTSIMLLIPSDQNNIIALVFFSTEDTYDVYEQSFLDMVLSIK